MTRWVKGWAAASVLCVVAATSFTLAALLLNPLSGEVEYRILLSSIPQSLVGSTLSADQTLKSIELRVSFSQRLFEAAVVGVAAFWIFVFSERRRTRTMLRTRSQHFVFVSVGVLFVSSCYAHFRYAFAISTELGAAGSQHAKGVFAFPSLDLLPFQLLLFWQIAALLIAVLGAGSMFYMSSAESTLKASASYLNDY